jgi:hypothetical protein
MKKTKKSSNVKKGIEIGGVVTAAVLAAAAGAYFMSDKKTQKKAKDWMMNAKKDIAAKAKVAKKLGKEEYNMIVEQVIKRYGPLEKLTAKDVITATKQLKAEWTNIQKHAKTLVKPMVKKAAGAKKAPAKKTVKARK